MSLYLTFRQNKNFKHSYILVVMNGKRKILKKLGVLAYNLKMRKFVFTVEMMELFKLYNNGILINPKSFRILYNVVNRFIL